MPRRPPPPGPLPLQLQDIKPMLAIPSKTLPRTGAWHYEFKYD